MAVAGLALLAAAGCSSSGGSAGPSSSSPAAAAAGAPRQVLFPSTMLSLKTAGSIQGTGSPETDKPIPKAVLKDLHSVSYTDTADSSKSVVLMGGMGLPVQTAGSADKGKRLMTQWNDGADLAKIADVSPGAVGGEAVCAPDLTHPRIEQDCGWVDGAAALVMDFDGYSRAAAKTLIPKVLKAMVRT